MYYYITETDTIIPIKFGTTITKEVIACNRPKEIIH